MTRLRLVPLALVLLLAGCAHGRRAPGPRFAGVGSVAVLVNSSLPDAYAAARGLRPPQVRERVAGALRQAGVPVYEGAELDLKNAAPSVIVEIEPLRLADDDYALFVRVAFSEVVDFRRRSDLPLMVPTWWRSRAVRLRAADTAELNRAVDALTREWIQEYRAANPTG